MESSSATGGMTRPATPGGSNDRLTARFGGDRVFMDVEGIEPGTDFVLAIPKAVGSPARC